MKKKLRTVLYFLIAVVVCSAIFSAMIHFTVTEKSAEAEGDVQSVPYYEQEPPDNAGLLFRFENNGSVFLNLDFYEKKVSVIFFDTKIAKQRVLDYGYSLTATFDTDYIFLAELIDRFGGLELQTETQWVRYTGIQVTELLEQGKVEKRDVTEAVLGKIANNGFSKNDLTFLIKNTDTLLSYPQGYPLIVHLPDVSRTVNFVN